MPSMGDQGWTQVEGKKRTSVFNRLGNGNFKKSNYDHLDSITTRIYVANFPSHLSERELKIICGKAGVVADVCIGKHLNVHGQMFAIVRYLHVDDHASLVKFLCTIRIGNLRLHANVSRFPRDSMKVVGRDVSQGAGQKLFQGISKPKVFIPVVKNLDKKISFASMVKGDQGQEVGKPEQNFSKGVEVSSFSIDLGCDFMSKNAYPCALVGCFKDFRSIVNIRSLCQGEGFMDVEPVYLGGLWVLMDFNSTERRDAFLKHEAFEVTFSELKVWQNDFVVKERILWIEVEGVPLLAWCPETFRKIASKWGDLIFVDNTDATNRFSVRLGVKTMHAPLVFESSFVVVAGVEYCIRVRELSSWTPNFIAGFKDSEEIVGDDEEEDSEGNDSCSGHSVHSSPVAFDYLDESINDAHKDSAVLAEVGQIVVDEVLEKENEVTVAREKSEVSDPFNVGPLIDEIMGASKKRKDQGVIDDCVESSTTGVPPGFTPLTRSNLEGGGVDSNLEGGPGRANYDNNLPRTPVHNKVQVTSEVIADEVRCEHFKSDVWMAGKQKGSQSVSVLEKLDDAIAVGQAMGWDMTGCINTLQGIIATNGVPNGFK